MSIFDQINDDADARIAALLQQVLDEAPEVPAYQPDYCYLPPGALDEIEVTEEQKREVLERHPRIMQLLEDSIDYGAFSIASMRNPFPA